MKIKLMYKIHGLNAANGLSRAAGNNTFYEDLENDEGTGALDAARRYVREGSNDSMVIYRATILVRREQPPIEVLSIAHDGITVPL